MTTATRTALRATSASLARSSAILDRIEAAETASATRRRRSLELAAQAGLGPYSCRFVSLDLRPDDLPSVVRVAVPSRSLPFVSHLVEVQTAEAIASCDCIAASFGRACSHAGVGLLYAREAVRAFQTAASDLAAQLRADGNAEALRPSL